MPELFLRIAKRFIADVQRDDVAGLAAELAYRFLFAIFPFGIFVAALTAFVAPSLGFQDPTSQLLGAIGDNLPAEVAAGIRPQLEAVIGTTQPGLLTLGAITALWAATGGTNSLIKAMNRSYEVEETRPLIPRYALAIGLTVLASIGLLVAFVTIVGASALTSEVTDALRLDPEVVSLVSLLRWPVVLVGLSAAVGVLYKLAPNFRAPWRWCLAGGAIFSIGWVIGTAALGLYVANFGNYSNTYGALGGVVVLMLWFYLSSAVLIGSAAFVASAMKEMRPETFAIGRAAAEQAAQDAAAKDAAVQDAAKPRERSTDAIDPGRPVEAARGIPAATALRVPAPPASPASPAASWAAAGVAVAAGVAIGTFAARLAGRSDR